MSTRQQTQLFISIKALRRKGNAMLDGINTLKKEGDFNECSREVSLAAEKVEEAIMWLGKALGSLGSDLPERYKDLPQGDEKWYTPTVELFQKADMPDPSVANERPEVDMKNYLQKGGR